MKPERWREIDRVFAEALEREPNSRAAYLDAVCGTDAELRREVESLLAHDLPNTIVGEKAAEEATQFLTAQGATREIGPYQIVRSLGIGGMGRVFLAHDNRLNRLVAVKLISHYTAAEEERVRRFRQEALAVSALNHPNILTIYEIGEADGNSFIATEFVDGLTLRELMDRSSISIEKCIDIAKQVATALSAAHSAGIIHRDIKPPNIMVRNDGLVKILDFGIAKFTQPTSETLPDSGVETLPGTVVGTAAYMSPEQARGKPIDQRSDIWSLGVILYEMIAGRQPFEGKTALDLMAAVIDRQPASLSTSGKVVPPLLEKIVFKALDKEQEKRYQNTAEVLADLNECTSEIASTSNVERVSNQSQSDGHLSAPTLNEHAVRDASKHSGATNVQTSNRTGDALGDITKREFANRRTRKPLILGGLIALLLVVGGLVYWRYSRPLSPIESIAVLPFKNETNNTDLDWLSDGMPDSLINTLSQIPRLSVKSRSSVFRYKGQEVEPQKVAKELSVQAVLEGRVVQHGNDVTISLSLVDGSSGNQIWGEQYDRKMSQVVTLQSEIARDVSQKLRVRLSGEDQRKLVKDYTANPQAYELYMRGRVHVFKLVPPEVEQGIADFQHAIALDPNYALAYVGLSEGNRSLALGSEFKAAEYLPRAKEAAQKALLLDDSLSEAHTAIGTTIYWYDRNWAEAESHLKRALELNPMNFDAHLFYAHLLSTSGRHDQAIAEIRRARELDPVNPFVSSLEGQFLVHAGRSDEALTTLKETTALAPGFWFPHLFASSAYVEKGMYAEAIAEAHRAEELSKWQTVSLAYEGMALARWGKRTEAQAVLDKLFKLSHEQGRWVPPVHFAIIYSAMGNKDEAIAWLNKAIEQHDPKLAFLKVGQGWENLRSDPRFQDIMKRVGF